ncbi:MAG: hypothetical protein AMXMBFR7_50980 [Planctomycetota bacterium]
MGEPGRTIHIRLSPRLQRKLEALHGNHYAGLPLSTIAKLLLQSQLQKEEEEVIAIIQEQIRTPAPEAEGPKAKGRIPNLNKHKPRSRR